MSFGVEFYYSDPEVMSTVGGRLRELQNLRSVLFFILIAACICGQLYVGESFFDSTFLQHTCFQNCCESETYSEPAFAYSLLTRDFILRDFFSPKLCF